MLDKKKKQSCQLEDRILLITVANSNFILSRCETEKKMEPCSFLLAEFFCVKAGGENWWVAFLRLLILIGLWRFYNLIPSVMQEKIVCTLMYSLGKEKK